MKPDLSVVVPLFNEEPNLLDLHRELSDVLTAWGRSYEIILVDDGSTDGSFSVLADIQSYFGDLLYKTAIRTNVKLEEAVSYGIPITRYAKKSSGYADYAALAMEVIQQNSLRLGKES